MRRGTPTVNKISSEFFVTSVTGISNGLAWRRLLKTWVSLSLSPFPYWYFIDEGTQCKFFFLAEKWNICIVQREPSKLLHGRKRIDWLIYHSLKIRCTTWTVCNIFRETTHQNVYYLGWNQFLFSSVKVSHVSMYRINSVFSARNVESSTIYQGHVCQDCKLFG